MRVMGWELRGASYGVRVAECELRGAGWELWAGSYGLRGAGAMIRFFRSPFLCDHFYLTILFYNGYTLTIY